MFYCKLPIELPCLVIQFCVISCSDLSVNLFSNQTNVQCSESYDDEPQRQRDVVKDAKGRERDARGDTSLQQDLRDSGGEYTVSATEQGY